ncbi:MAG: PorP/SprF family type IX secretion system membrane protein [Flavobacteriales bacterium]|nr:PorP/SprF family type IX secretion system membrane protein [Flavobacteriales bacterium]
MKRKYLLILSLCTVILTAKSQDIHLSQFYAQDILLNPASTGNYEGDFRASANYREQWKQVTLGEESIGSYMIGFEKPIYILAEKLDLGFIVTQDKYADLNISGNKILFSSSYSTEFRGNIFRLGLQFGPVFRKASFDDFTFPNQWVYYPDAFDTGLPNNETGLNNSSSYFDMNTGLVWKREYNRFNIESGFALNHFNRPKDTHFQSFTEKLRTKKVLHTFVQYDITSTLRLEPKILVAWTAGANEIILGGNVMFRSLLQFIPWVYTGLYYRHGVSRNLDSFVPVFGVTYGNFDFGLSYDYNISDLSGVDSRKGAIEFSLIFTSPSTKNEIVVLPCTRF